MNWVNISQNQLTPLTKTSIILKNEKKKKSSDVAKILLHCVLCTHTQPWKSFGLRFEKMCLFVCFLSVQQLTGVARFNDGTVAEDKIDLRFDVEDENDNPPVFVSVPPAIVSESSPAGKTFCLQPPTFKTVKFSPLYIFTYTRHISLLLLQKRQLSWTTFNQ